MRLDKKRFWPSILMIVLVLLAVLINLEAIKGKISLAYDACISSFSWFFILSDLVALIFSLFIMFGPYRNVRLGGADAKPAFNTFSWAAMMFTTSCGAWLIVYGFLEPIYCAAQPPFQLEPLSIQAFEYGQTYAHFHWGPNAWCIYVPASVAMSYMIYNRGRQCNTIAAACEPVLGRWSRGFGGWVIDICSIFGVVVSPVISLGTGMPLLTALARDLFGITEDYTRLLEVGILGIWILIFGTSVYLGLRKGIKRLSDLNTGLAFAFMAVIAVMGGVFSIISSEINAAGLFASNYIRMSAYTDPYGPGSFVKGWTASYWAVYFVYMPLLGIFNARISKGRTLREVAFGQLVLCSLGCWASMATLGNYSLGLQLRGELDVASVLSGQGEAAAIMEIVRTMPFSKVVMAILLLLSFIFLATTMDSSAFAAAEMTIRQRDSETLAPRWLRVVWAVMACCIALVLLMVGGFQSVRLLAIMVGLPLAVLMYMVVASVLKMLKEDQR